MLLPIQYSPEVAKVCSASGRRSSKSVPKEDILPLTLYVIEGDLVGPGAMVRYISPLQGPPREWQTCLFPSLQCLIMLGVGNPVLCPHSWCFGSHLYVMFMHLVSSGFSFKPTSSIIRIDQFSQDWVMSQCTEVVVKHSRSLKSIQRILTPSLVWAEIIFGWFNIKLCSNAGAFWWPLSYINDMMQK